MDSERSYSAVLDALESNVNAILLQTGSVFADATNYEPGHILRTSSRVKQFLPPALSHFHDALNELEGELMRAKVVIQRDIASCRAKRLNDSMVSASDIPTSGEATAQDENVIEPAQAKGVNDNSTEQSQPVGETTNGDGMASVVSEHAVTGLHSVADMPSSNATLHAARLNQNGVVSDASVVPTQPYVARSVMLENGASPSTTSRKGSPETVAIQEPNQNIGKEAESTLSTNSNQPILESLPWSLEEANAPVESSFSDGDLEFLLPGFSMYANSHPDNDTGGSSMDALSTIPSALNGTGAQDSSANPVPNSTTAHADPTNTAELPQDLQQMDFSFEDIFSAADGEAQEEIDINFDDDFFNIDGN